MNISITGNLGGGKSSVCKELEKFGHEIISGGSIFRSVAKEKGISVIEMNELAKTDPSIDKLIDSRTEQLNKEKTNAVFDSRLAWNFAKDSFKVFLLVELSEAANRVFNGDAREAENYENIDAARENLAKRAALETERYKSLYDVDYYDLKNYDLVIESTHATPYEIANEIERNYQLFQNEPFKTKLELNLRCMYPTCAFDFVKPDAPEPNTGSMADKKTPECFCTDAPITLVSKNHFHYIENGCTAVFQALHNGMAFGTVTGFSVNDALETSPVDLKPFEQYGGFAYKYDPSRDAIGGYHLDFTKIML